MKSIFIHRYMIVGNGVTRQKLFKLNVQKWVPLANMTELEKIFEAVKPTMGMLKLYRHTMRLSPTARQVCFF